MVSWSFRLTLDQAVWVQSLSRDIVLYSCSRHFHSTSLYPGVQMGTVTVIGWGNPE